MPCTSLKRVKTHWSSRQKPGIKRKQRGKPREAWQRKEKKLGAPGSWRGRPWAALSAALQQTARKANTIGILLPNPLIENSLHQSRSKKNADLCPKLGCRRDDRNISAAAVLCHSTLSQSSSYLTGLMDSFLFIHETQRKQQTPLQKWYFWVRVTPKSKDLKDFRSSPPVPRSSCVQFLWTLPSFRPLSSQRTLKRKKEKEENAFYCTEGAERPKYHNRKTNINSSVCETVQSLQVLTS